MFWKVNGVGLEDLVPIPKAQPGRHFTTGHRILGSLTPALDAKYAQMTYGDHYRKKVEAALELERLRCVDLLAEQKKKASAQKKLTPIKKTPVSSQLGTRPQPRYDLNELRHHQRRCAALLFRAREQGAHKLPVLVQWAPKRRESYYLMSERVYNDRLLMKMRADAGVSPLNFDFANTDGETDDLLEFQRFINKTSKDIKQLSFDTTLNDYTYDFGENEGEKQMEYMNEDGGANEQEGFKTTGDKSRRKVVFSDHVTESDTNAIDAKSLARSKQRERARLSKGMDLSDIDLSFDSGDGFPDGEHGSSKERGTDSGGKGLKDSKRSSRSKNSRKGLSSPDLLSLLHGTSGDDYSSDFTPEDDLDEKRSGDEDHIGLPENGDEYLSEKKAHRNKHCKHTLKQKTQDYYNKLPQLLKTAELRAKLPAKSRETEIDHDKISSDVDHQCMEQHKVAYERALALARFRSLPFSYSFLSRKINKMNSFSYFSGLPGSEKTPENREEDENKLKKKKLAQATPGGREAIFGDIDMDDFYNQEDELIYFVRSDELKNVVASTTTGDESSRNEEDISTRSVTTYTSRSNTVKAYSALESENEL